MTVVKNIDILFRGVLPAAMLLGVLAFVSGCGKSGAQPEDGSDYISFGGVATSSSHTSSASASASLTKVGTESLINTDDELKTEPFGIFGYKSMDDKTNFVSVFEGSGMQKVEYSDDNWTYSPKQKWQRAMHYRFRAIWPYSAEVKANSNANLVSVDYSCVNDSYDLLAAYATRYPVDEGVGRVTMNFKHLLSGLRFKIKYRDSISSPETVSDAVTEFYITGIYPAGQLFYGLTSTSEDTDNVSWIVNENSFESKNPLFDWTGNKEFGVVGYKGYAPIYFTESTDASGKVTTDGAALIVPQTISSSVGDTYVNFYTTVGGSALQKVKLPQRKLEAGKIYTYTLILQGTQVQVTVDIADWDDIKSNIDIVL